MADSVHARLRRLIVGAFSDGELSDFCFDYFRPVYQDFAEGMSKSQKARLLVDYCLRQERLPDLVAALRRERPSLDLAPLLAALPQETAAAHPAPRAQIGRTLRRPIARTPIPAWAALLALALLVATAIWFATRSPDATDTVTPSPEATPAAEATRAEVSAGLATAVSATLWPTFLAAPAYQGTLAVGETVTAVLPAGGTAVHTWLIPFDADRSRIHLRLDSSGAGILRLYDQTAQGWENPVDGAVRQAPSAGQPAHLRNTVFFPGSGYVVAVSDANGEAASYRLTVQPANPTVLRAGEVVQGQLVGPEPDVYRFEDGPAQLSLLLEPGPNQAGELFVLDAATGAQIDYAGGATGTPLQVTGLVIPDASPVEIVVWDAHRDNQADAYTLRLDATPWGDAQPATPAAGLTAGATRTRAADNMVTLFVPGGAFAMGSPADDPDAQANEIPQHPVTLDAFWLDQTEVTNQQFAAFLTARGNQAEADLPWLDLQNVAVGIEQAGTQFRPLTGFGTQPVVAVSWYGARAYCEWVGGRLPTEAEWEYAARGTAGSRFPWGNDAPPTPDCDLAHYGGCAREMAPVGTHPLSHSWIGAADMAGNAREWVADWYGDYAAGAIANPTGAARGSARIQRGGDRTSTTAQLRAAARLPQDPAQASTTSGFRCAANP
ncbi:MAG: formylglycine-generating enzyme family protein [Anaerolineales bacterium]|nr:formylglycine-generating enzyme family protein [Anaerolineales bacterium]